MLGAGAAFNSPALSVESGSVYQTKLIDSFIPTLEKLKLLALSCVRRQLKVLALAGGAFN